MKTVGACIREARKRAGLSRSDFAERVGISKGSVTIYEKDHGYPTLINLISMADALGMRIDDLIGRKTEPCRYCKRFAGVTLRGRDESITVVCCPKCGRNLEDL